MEEEEIIYFNHLDFRDTMKKPIKICVTGGKGGTGKTLVAINLAVMFRDNGKKILLLDGDVENPNTYLLLGTDLENGENVHFFIPKVNEDKCTKCGLCAKNCASNAILFVKDAYPIIIPNVCSGCKLCYKICPVNAIEENSKIIGKIYEKKLENMALFVGELKVSEARSAVIVEEAISKLNARLEKNNDEFDIIIYDTAPGAHCDVEKLIKEADLVIPVTEPTPFGKLDLMRIIELIELMEKKYKVIINRSSLLGFKDDFIKELKEKKIDILGEIPLDQEIVNSYCQGIPLMAKNSPYDMESPGAKAFENIFSKLNEWVRDYSE